MKRRPAEHLPITTPRAYSMPMILYHFTASRLLQDRGTILTEGLRPRANPRDRPSCPVVWLTTVSEPNWCGWNWRRYRDDSIRLTVEIPNDDERLVRWEDWVGDNVPAAELDRIRRHGGLNALWWDGSYYCYFGTVTPDRIQAIESPNAFRPPSSPSGR